jgi:hypothetical protein
MSLPLRSRPLGAEEILVTAMRSNYQDAVRLSAHEEILAELADADTARLHADTARFHHGSAHAYAKALELLIGEEFDVYEDKQQARWTTREADLTPMLCRGRQYRTFNPHKR